MKRLFILLPLLIAACGESTVRDTLGIGRKAPDEFRVVSRPPLSVPPDFSLRPPGEAGQMLPGEAAPEKAKTLLMGDDGSGLKPGSAETAVQAVTSTGLESPADTQFLSNAGADKADPAVRTQLGAETVAQEEEDKSLLEKLREPFSAQPTVDAEKEAERLKENKAAGKPVTEGETPTETPKDTGTLGRIFGY